MWLVKSIGLGLLAVLAALFITVVGIVVTLMVMASPSEEGSAVGWDPVSLMRQQPLVPTIFVALLCLLFAAGFGFGYRRYRLP